MPKEKQITALFLDRKVGQSIMINDDIVITVYRLHATDVKIQITAPREYKVYREEVYQRILKEKEIERQQLDKT